MLDYADYLKLLISLLAISDPFGTVPVFISMTADENRKQLLQTINHVAIGVAVILLTVLVCGELLLEFFGISISSFRIAGGILLLIIALSMLNAQTSAVRQTDEEAEESIEKQSVAIVPLAMPLLAGPGTISTVILAAHTGSGIAHYGMIALTILVLCAAIWLVLRLAPWITRRIGATGIHVFTRIMGLILTAIAVEFIANGMKGLFPALA